MIKVSNIANATAQLRKVNKNAEGFIGICENMRERGFDPAMPIKVRPTPSDWKDNEEYILIDGLHRLTAAREVGLEEVPCVVVDADETDAMIQQLVANAHRVETRPCEYAAQIIRIMCDKPAITKAEIGKMLSLSTDRIERILAINKLDEKIKVQVDAGTIPLLNAFQLSKLIDQEDVLSFVEQAASMKIGEFTNLVNARNAEVRKARLEGRKVGDVAVFQPNPRLRKNAELKELLVNPAPIIPLLSGITDPVEAAQMVIKYIMHVDPITLEAEKNAFDKAQAEKKAMTIAKAQATLEKKQLAAKKLADEIKEAAEVAGEAAGEVPDTPVV